VRSVLKRDQRPGNHGKLGPVRFRPRQGAVLAVRKVAESIAHAAGVVVTIAESAWEARGGATAGEGF